MLSKRMFLSAILLAGFTLIHCNSQSGSDELASEANALTTALTQADDVEASEEDLDKRVPPPPPRPAPPPPEEAFTACSSKTEGDACSLTSDESELEGTCRIGPQKGSKLACAPPHQPPPPPPTEES